MARADEAPGGRATVTSLPAAEASVRRRHDLVGVLALVVVLAFLWGRGAWTWYWLDEGISLGIASLPARDIPGILRMDGAPPLYFLLLHWWTEVTGTSEAATHALSLVFALATVPAALWAGSSLFGRRAGWSCALLVAASPFLARYAVETRMYSLVVLLALVAAATFVHGFIRARRGHVVAFALALVLLMYTHNWGLFFALGAALALAITALLLPGERARVLLHGGLALAVAALLYAPWVPTLLYQRAHTGAPSLVAPSLVQAREDVTRLFGEEVVVALGLGAGVGLATMLRRPWGRPAVAVLSTAAIAAVTLAAGWAASQVTSAWTLRYLAVALAPLLLVVSFALSRAGPLGLSALGLTVLLTAPLGVKTPLYQKSNLKAVARAASPLLGRGDLVVSPDYGQVPLLAHYLPPGLRYADGNGPMRHVRVSDQRDGLRRMRQSSPRLSLPPLLDSLPAGAHVLVVCPPKERPSGTVHSALVRAIFRHCDEMNEVVMGDPRFRRELSVNPPVGVRERPVVAQLLTRLHSEEA